MCGEVDADGLAFDGLSSDLTGFAGECIAEEAEWVVACACFLNHVDELLKLVARRCVLFLCVCASL
jgi:hypothetical protein